jgi:hypothetical protein
VAGGLLNKKQVITLNHHADQMQPDPLLQPHPRWRIVRDDGWCGRGEDDPLELVRMLRDGWEEVQRGHANFDTSRKASAFVIYDPPEILEIKNPKTKSVSLRRERRRALVRQGKHYDESFEVRKGDTVLRRFDNMDWASWDHDGDLLLANDGKITSLRHGHVQQLCENCRRM